MSTQAKDDLGWDAFRYIAEEMSREERQRFEQLLAESQPAREAVALAVEIAQGTAAGLDQSATIASAAPRRSWRLHAAWSAAAALAVCLAFAMGLNRGAWLTSPAPSGEVARSASPQETAVTEDQSSNSTLSAAQLVSLWTQAGAAASDGATAGPDDLGGEPRELLAVAGPELAAEATGESSLDVPDWMWAAVMADLPAGSASPIQPTEEN